MKKFKVGDKVIFVKVMKQNNYGAELFELPDERNIEAHIYKLYKERTIMTITLISPNGTYPISVDKCYNNFCEGELQSVNKTWKERIND